MLTTTISHERTPLYLNSFCLWLFSYASWWKSLPTAYCLVYESGYLILYIIITDRPGSSNCKMSFLEIGMHYVQRAASGNKASISTSCSRVDNFIVPASEAFYVMISKFSFHYTHLAKLKASSIKLDLSSVVKT